MTINPIDSIKLRSPLNDNDGNGEKKEEKNKKIVSIKLISPLNDRDGNGINISYKNGEKIEINIKNLIVTSTGAKEWIWEREKTKVVQYKSLRFLHRLRIRFPYHYPGIPTNTVENILDMNPQCDVLIISRGCGYEGNLHGELPLQNSNIQKQLKIKIIQERSNNAVKTFNQYIADGYYPVLMLHTSC